MLLGIVLLAAGWWCRRHARALEVAHHVPAAARTMEVILEVVYDCTRDRVVLESRAGRNGGGSVYRERNGGGVQGRRCRTGGEPL